MGVVKLTVVKLDLGAHGGKISVRNDNEMGNIFSIYLPLTTTEAYTVVTGRKK
jgi:K+-sensing histidine kinase KdpD